LNTALSGLTSQSAAFGNISDNIANSQTVGFKATDTNFLDYVTDSSATENDPGGVVAVPLYTNNVQGTVSQSSDPLALAISGQGFFSVSQPTTTTTSSTAFAVQTQYTRAGDFQLNNQGYLVNSAGNYLNGWVANASGTLDTSTLAPIQISETTASPIPTSNVSLSANLPPAGDTSGTPPAQVPINSIVSVYDAQGQAHQLTLSYLSAGAGSNSWTVTATDDSGNTIATGTVAFAPNGTLASVTQSGTTQSTAGSPAALTLSTLYPIAGASGALQTISLNLGTIGSAGGLTQFAGSAFSLQGLTQDGVPPGSFSSVTTNTTGDIIVNYSNGQSRTVAQVPVTTFAAPDSLQRQDGSAFTATLAAGTPLAQAAGNNGAGSLVTGSVEESNVDIATEFSQLIVAQQAYSANAKTITTASQMLQTTIDMKQ
jgi:flagellar hook protein FlgE